MDGEDDGKLLLNLGEGTNERAATSSQDLAKALVKPQVVEWIQLVEPFENRPNQEIESFVESIDNIAEMVGWGDAEKLVCCRMKLKGSALTVLRAHPQMKTCKTWVEFVDFLYQNFKVYKSRASSFDRFFSCVQKHNESVRDFATRLRLAGKGTVADGPVKETAVRNKVFEENILAVFLKGIRPGIQRFVLSRSPRNFDQAVRYAEEEAQNESLTSVKGYAQVVEERNEGLGRAREDSRRPDFRSGDRKCFNCNATSHIARFCPSRKCRKCGRSGHFESECQVAMACDKCGRNNHTAGQCKAPVCTFCGKIWHTEDKCFEKRDLNSGGLRQGPNADRPVK